MAGMDWLAQDTVNRVGDFMDSFRVVRASNAAAKADAAAKAKNEAALDATIARGDAVNNAFNNGLREGDARAAKILGPVINKSRGSSDFNFINAQAWQRTAEMVNNLLPEDRKFDKNTLRQLTRLNRLSAIQALIKGEAQSSKTNPDGTPIKMPAKNQIDAWKQNDPSYIARVAQEADQAQAELIHSGHIKEGYNWRTRYAFAPELLAAAAEVAAEMAAKGA